MALRATYRESHGITVVDIGGRITLGEGSALLRKTVRDLLEEKRILILLNLADVDYIDSSVIGELVSAYTGVKNRGGAQLADSRAIDVIDVGEIEKNKDAFLLQKVTHRLAKQGAAFAKSDSTADVDNGDSVRLAICGSKGHRLD